MITKYLIERVDNNKWGALGVKITHRPQKVNWYSDANLTDQYDTYEDAEFMLGLYKSPINEFETIVTEHQFG